MSQTPNFRRGRELCTKFEKFKAFKGGGHSEGITHTNINNTYNIDKTLDLRYNYVKLQDRDCRRSIIGCSRLVVGQ